MSLFRIASLSLVSAIAIGALFLPSLESAEPNTIRALALTVFVIGLLATGSLPEIHTSAIYFILAISYRVAPVETVLSCFVSSAFWLVAGGVALGIAAIKTGLGARIAGLFFGHLRYSYFWVISAVVVCSVFLAFLIPAAIARMIILMPVILSLADRLGFVPGRKGRVGMALAVVASSFYIPMTILPSNFPNVLMAGLVQKIYGIDITYGEYLMMNFPIGGALKMLVIVGLICWLFNDRIDAQKVDHAIPARMLVEGRRLAVIVGLTVCAWATDFIHGVQPGWIAVASAAICFLPGIGVLKVHHFKGRLNDFKTLFFAATAMSLGAVIAESGAGKLIAESLFSSMEIRQNSPILTFYIFSAINILMAFVATMPGTVVVLTPFAGSVAETSGMALLPVIMMITNGYSSIFLPYQAPPIVAGLRMGGVTIADGAKLTATLSLISVAALLPLTYLWWVALGYI